jgi:hypothetical protein
MSARRNQLLDMAERQIAELLMLLSTVEDEILRRRCPGREKLGDGTIGALVRHVADSYERIAAFVRSWGATPWSRARGERGGHRVPDPVGGSDHGSTEPTRYPGGKQLGAGSVAGDAAVRAVIAQLAVARDDLAHIAELTNGQLDAAPQAGSFRFCDGRRTLEQVLASLLKHQGHQLDALKAAMGPAPSD